MEQEANNQPINFLEAQQPQDYDALAEIIAQKIIRNTAGGAQIKVNGKWTGLGGVQVKIDRASGTASYPATQTYNCGFSPKLLTIKAYRSNANSAWSWGETDGTFERNIFYNPNVDRIQESNYIIYLKDASGNVDGKASATLTASGFTLEWLDYPSNLCYFTYIAIG